MTQLNNVHNKNQIFTSVSKEKLIQVKDNYNLAHYMDTL